MIIASLALLVASGINRDAYGVPTVTANSAHELWRLAGYSVAQDRIWQMENSRRLARGRMAEAFGSKFLASDQEVLKTRYTDAEYQQQLDALPADLKEAFAAYAEGVNDFIREGNLPAGYANNGLKPEPWTPLDSAAISVRLLQYFGQGGAGELRNMALLSYLQGQPKTKDRALDVLDDLGWQNDASSPTTLAPEDTPANPPRIPVPTRADTIRHAALLPRLTLFDILPALNLAMRVESSRVALNVGAPSKTGSYCMVVAPSRSSTGRPLLLSGPQMGFSDPSPVHEMALKGAGIDVAGADLPGVPGILIGRTPKLAWGLTSGVADTDDIVFSKADTATTDVSFPLAIKDQPARTFVQRRTADGPVMLEAKGTRFARRSSYRMAELQSLEALSGLWHAGTASEADHALTRGTMSFNAFYALTSGEIGYRYVGRIPKRAPGYDPRFPTPASVAWQGYLSADEMPHVINPKSGLLTNWNNKPAKWWPNGDTPVWGAIFHVDEIRTALNKPKLNAQDLEIAAWTIARRDENYPFFAKYLPAAPQLDGFDGRLLAGSRQAAAYTAWFTELRKEIFYDTVGGLATPDTFKLVLQPSLMLRALQGKTKVDYLHGRKPSMLALAALAKVAPTAGYVPGSINYSGVTPVPHRNRGTYLQVVELLNDGPYARTMLPPGNAESGPHSRDQVDLARAWIWK